MVRHRSLDRLDILGIHVTPMTMRNAVDVVACAVRSRTKIRGVFSTTHTVVESQRLPQLMDAVNESDIVATDGMPLVWLSRLKGAKGVERIYGPDTLLAVCDFGVSEGWSHYFYGSTPETLSKLTAALENRFHGIRIVGSYAPPFRELTDHERKEIIERINAAEPDLVWVGLGMPKQELWSAEYQKHLEAPVILAVGAAFDFHAGTVKQAPRWMQRSGTEWLFRLVQEPKRLWRRYLIGNMRFLWLLLSDSFRSSEQGT